MDEGAAIYRTRQPCRALGELPEVAVASGSILSPALLDTRILLAADVLVIRDVAHPDLLPIVAARRRQRRLSVYEITNHLFAVPQGGGSAERPIDLVERSLRPLLARQADCLQFATPALEATFAALNPRRAVFPSQLWEVPPPKALRHREGVVIGWSGSAAHREDLRAVLPALAGVVERHPEVHVAIMCDAAVRPVLDRLAARSRDVHALGIAGELLQVPRGHRHRHRPAAADHLQPLPGRRPLRRVRRARRAGRVLRPGALPRRRPARPDRLPVPGRRRAGDGAGTGAGGGGGARGDPGARGPLRRQRAHGASLRERAPGLLPVGRRAHGAGDEAPRGRRRFRRAR